MPRHDVNKDATKASRRKGAMAAAAAKRSKRAEAEQLAAERLTAMIDKALAELERLLDSEEDHVRVRAVKEVLDRVLGRPAQAVELDVGWPSYVDLGALDDEELATLKALLIKGQPSENGA